MEVPLAVVYALSLALLAERVPASRILAVGQVRFDPWKRRQQRTTDLAIEQPNFRATQNRTRVLGQFVRTLDER